MKITVTAAGESTYRVTVSDAGSSTQHEVTASAADIQRYAPGVPAERLIEASFQFLLEREPAESILSRFELPIIERYFPEYPVEIRKRVRAG
jgi:hypothetical protein